MGVLTQAIQRQQWELVAYCLLIAVAEAAERVPPESLDELIRLLAEGDDGASS